MKIRKFKSKDANILSKIMIDNLKFVNNKDYPPRAIDALIKFYTPKKLISYIGDGFIIVCKINNIIVGTASLDNNRVRNVFIDIKTHKRGVGTFLMTEIEKIAKEQNYTKIWLTSGLSAVFFYKKLNYEIVAKEKELLNDVKVDLVKMQKQLT